MIFRPLPAKNPIMLAETALRARREQRANIMRACRFRGRSNRRLYLVYSVDLLAACTVLLAVHDLAGWLQIQRQRAAFSFRPFHTLQPMACPAARCLKCFSIEQLLLLTFLKFGVRLRNRSPRLHGFLR
jgi:hypothetical protein